MRTLSLLFWCAVFCASSTLVVAQTQNALSFDGTDDYVNAYNVGLSASSGTIECWVNCANTSAEQTFVDLGGGTFVLSAANSNQLYFKAGGTQVSVPFTPNTWNHVAMAWSGNGVVFLCYLNGSLVATAVQGSGTISGNFVNMGRNTTTNNKFLNGMIDEVRLWTTTRTQAQIQGSMNCEAAGNEDGQQSCYHFNQGTAGGSNAGVVNAVNANASGQGATLYNFTLSGSTSNWVAGNSAIGIVGTLLATTNATCVGTGSVSVSGADAATQIQWQQNGTTVGTAVRGSATSGVVVGGGNGQGSAANQLNTPYGIALDASGSVYVADALNHRIQKWVAGATAGVTVAGGSGAGNGDSQFLELVSILPIAAAGNSITPRNYHTTDEAPAAGTNYYRLRTTDADDKAAFSEIRSVTYDTNGMLVLYPNPATNSVTVQQTNAEHATLNLRDALGRTITTYTDVSLAQPYSIPLSDLPEGIYFVEVRSGNIATTRKLVKQ